MYDLLVKLDTGGTIRGTIMWDPDNPGPDIEVYSAHDSIAVMSKKSRAYASQLWRKMRKSLEYDKFVWYVPLRVKSRPSPYKQPVVTREGPALTRKGLKFLMMYLQSIKQFKLDDDAFSRFMKMDRTMIVEYQYNSLVPRVRVNQ
jgi:hypothetical protein